MSTLKIDALKKDILEMSILKIYEHQIRLQPQEHDKL